MEAVCLQLVSVWPRHVFTERLKRTVDTLILSPCSGSLSFPGLISVVSRVPGHPREDYRVHITKGKKIIKHLPFFFFLSLSSLSREEFLS